MIIYQKTKIIVCVLSDRDVHAYTQNVKMGGEVNDECVCVCVCVRVSASVFEHMCESDCVLMCLCVLCITLGKMCQ